MRRLLAGALLAALAWPAMAQTPVNIPTVNRSVTISSGNVFQTVVAATASTTDYNRKSLTLQNNNTNNDSCWVFIGALGSATKQTSILLAPGGSYQRYMPYIPSDAINATCATSNDTLYIDTQ